MSMFTSDRRMSDERKMIDKSNGSAYNKQIPENWEGEMRRCQWTD